MINVLIYNEFIHENVDENVNRIYPNGIHIALKNALESNEIEIRTFTVDTVSDITDEVLKDTDVIIWWGHMAHDKVPDEVAARVQNAVLKGMGAIFLHSGHHSKPFRLLMGTSCNLGWREDGDLQRVWNASPYHPIAQGIDRCFEIEHDETYCEPFDIPNPDDTVFISWYSGGELMRTGCCWSRGRGKVFYFQPGHETYPVYYNENVIKVIRNAIYWAKPTCRIDRLEAPWVSRANKD